MYKKRPRNENVSSTISLTGRFQKHRFVWRTQFASVYPLRTSRDQRFRQRFPKAKFINEILENPKLCGFWICSDFKTGNWTEGNDVNEEGEANDESAVTHWFNLKVEAWRRDRPTLPTLPSLTSLPCVQNPQHLNWITRQQTMVIDSGQVEPYIARDFLTRRSRNFGIHPSRYRLPVKSPFEFAYPSGLVSIQCMRKLTWRSSRDRELLRSDSHSRKWQCFIDS